MAGSGNLRLNRQQLAQFLPNAEAIKAFEQLFESANVSIPSDLEGVEASAQAAQLQAAEALSALAAIANDLAYVLNGAKSEIAQEQNYIPPQLEKPEQTFEAVKEQVSQESVYVPPSSLGTLSEQNADNVNIKGGKASGLTTVGTNNVAFPATQVPSSDPNTLDDYEEGNFTPAIIGFSTAGVGTYSVQVGSYVKIGSMVSITVNLTVTAHTGTGVMILTGLPFPSAADKSFALSGRVNNLAYTAGNTLQFMISGGSTSVDLEQMPSGGAASNIPMDTSFSISLTGTYFV